MEHYIENALEYNIKRVKTYCVLLCTKLQTPAGKHVKSILYSIGHLISNTYIK